jgi:hypothetical protein
VPGQHLHCRCNCTLCLLGLRFGWKLGPVHAQNQRDHHLYRCDCQFAIFSQLFSAGGLLMPSSHRAGILGAGSAGRFFPGSALRLSFVRGANRLARAAFGVPAADYFRDSRAGSAHFDNRVLALQRFKPRECPRAVCFLQS